MNFEPMENRSGSRTRDPNLAEREAGWISGSSPRLLDFLAYVAFCVVAGMALAEAFTGGIR